MKKILLLLCCLAGGFASAQTVVTINAQLANSESKRPIEFANVRFLDKNVGTVSNTKGRFYLKFDEDAVGTEGVLQISALGFQTKQVKLSELYDYLGKTNTLFLDPSSEVLSEGITRVSGNQGRIKGKVKSAVGPVQGAIVQVKGTFNEAVTNVDGAFTIDAKEGETLVISSLGMIPTERTLGSNNTLKVDLEVDGEILDEVALRGEKKREYGNTQIETAYGKRDFNKLGFSASQITEEQILPSYQTLDQIMVKLTGVQFSGVPGQRVYYFTRNIGSSVSQSTLPVVVVDDIPYAQGENNPLPAIDVQNIHSVTALPSLAATVKYGTLARSGAIIIRTKGYNLGQSGGEVDNQRKALVKGNNFNEQLDSYDREHVMPNYFTELKNAGSLNAAKRTYKKHEGEKGKYGIPYYIDAAEVFSKYDLEVAGAVASQIAEVAPNNVRALKSAAYKLEELGELEQAKNIYQRIALLQPQAAQSYRDLAHIFKETGEITKSFGLYKQILANATPDVDFSGLQKSAEHELRQLVANHKRKIKYSDLPNDLLDAKFNKDIRVLFEWNNPSAEFEIQFVNPQRKFFTWKHDLFTNKARLLEEVKQGYSQEEFIIDDSNRGQWQVNIRYLGDEIASKNPTFLKYTLYKNYGLPTETKVVKTIKLYQHQDKVILDQFNY